MGEFTVIVGERLDTTRLNLSKTACPSRLFWAEASITSWKNRLRRMLFLDKLEPLVGQTPKVADFGSKSAKMRSGNSRFD